MKPILNEEDRQERIAKVKKQLGSPKTSSQKRKELGKYLNKLMNGGKHEKDLYLRF